MSRSRSIAVLIFAVLGATLIFWLVIHQVSGLWLDVALGPEVREVLESSMEDQKKLAEVDATHREEYRRRFENTGRMLRRLDVIRMNRQRMLQRFESIVVTLFALVATVAAMLVWVRYRRAQTLERHQYVDRVSVLQETARRSAHEIKGPLTAARLELERAVDGLRDGAAEKDVTAALQSVADELEQLTRFTRQHASFAAIGTPVLREIPLGAMIQEFCSTFADAWPNVTLRFQGGEATVCADRDMLRQVLVNLCANSSRAIDGSGSVTFVLLRRADHVTLDVIDSGGGIPESLRSRVFDPYVTTRKLGEGMGLGLSISRKIMLDHGGDLELLATSSSGTTFRLTFGDRECS